MQSTLQGLGLVPTAIVNFAIGEGELERANRAGGAAKNPFAAPGEAKSASESKDGGAAAAHSQSQSQSASASSATATAMDTSPTTENKAPSASPGVAVTLSA